MKMVKSKNSVRMDGRKDPIGMEKKWKVLNEWYLGREIEGKKKACSVRKGREVGLYSLF